MSRTVLVTGAGSGIGAAAVLSAAAAGHRVAALDVAADGLHAVAAAATRAGAEAVLAVEADVRDEAEVERAFDRTRSELGTPTAVLANAGIEINGPAHELSREDWARTLDVNVTGAFLVARHAIRALLEERAGGSVVCTSSPAAFVGFAGGGNAAYAASKGGVSALVRSLAIDYAAGGDPGERGRPGRDRHAAAHRWRPGRRPRRAARAPRCRRPRPDPARPPRPAGGDRRRGACGCGRMRRRT